MIKMRVWLVRYYIGTEECLELFTEQWRAVAFFEDCPPETKPTLHALVEP